MDRDKTIEQQREILAEFGVTAFNASDVENLLITALRRDRELAEAVKQKDLLLSELQHRVKNNLQVIISMISSQREAVSVDFDIITSRVEALRLIYDKLYLTDHKGIIDFADYLSALCSSVLQFHLAQNRHIELVLHCPELRMDVDRCVPLGLLATEFLVNSFKHAYRSGGGGTIDVTFHRIGDDRAQLMLADDGSGLQPGHMRGTGMRLIEQLAQQADADIAWSSNPGTKLIVTFPVA